MADPIDRNEDRPWEQPGAVRKDCEPHRANLWRPLAEVCCALAGASCFCVPAMPVALPLSVVVFVLVKKDLARMRAGTMDPAGESVLLLVYERVKTAMVLSMLGPAFWVVVVAILATR